MIDIHSHILPDIDDGSKSKDMTFEMLYKAVNSGTKKIIATPHYCIGYWQVPYYEVKEMVNNLRSDINEINLDINIYHGQEIYFNNNLVKWYEEGIIGTINDTRYMLIELPIDKFDNDVLDIFYELQIKGIKIVLAHPERYIPIINDPTNINEFIKEGILFQVNSGSLLGTFGKKVKKTAEILINNNIYNFIGSDAHNNNTRNTDMSNIQSLSNKKLNIDIELLTNSSEKLLLNEDVNFIGEEVKVKKLYFNFFNNH